jgi:hypothetical protein
MAVDDGAPESRSPPSTSAPIVPFGSTGTTEPPDAPGWTLISLFLCLLGFLGVAGLLYGYKFLEIGAYYHGIPTRILFVLALALVGSPFYVTIARRVPGIFLILPVALLAFLYPLFSPYGLPYSRDTVFSFQFAQVLLQQHHWVPGGLVTNQAIVYSYYPGSGVFNAETSSFTGLPLIQTFNWGLQLFRFLVIPVGIYALTVRFFGPRAGPLAVFLYMGVPSIEVNIPTQQDFAMPFLLLMVLMAVYLIHTETVALTPLRVGFVIFSSFIIISHHLTSYIAGAWLAAILIFPYILRGRNAFDKLRPAAAVGRYLLVFLLFVLLVSGPAFVNHVQLLYTAVGSIFSGVPTTGRASTIGSTFPFYQTSWIFLSLGIVVLISLYVLVLLLRRPKLTFLSTLIVIALLTALVTIPFLPTGLSFLALRLMEYSELILAPVVAWFLVVYLQRERAAAPPTTSPSAAGSPEVPHPPSRRPTPRRSWLPVAAAVAISVVIFTGGSLVPLSTRDAFAPASAVLIDAPRYINQSAYDAALWAKANLPPTLYNASNHTWSHLVWGDYLVYSVYGGFGDFEMAWSPFHIFEHHILNDTNWTGIRVGDYVVTDVLMTEVIPSFPGPTNRVGFATSQPNAPILAVNLTKFQNNPKYFQPVYENPIFKVYVVIANPCNAPGAPICVT